MTKEERGYREEYLMTADIPYKDLRPHVLGHHICLPLHAHRPPLEKQAIIHYVMSGTGVYTDAQGRERRVRAGEIFINLTGEGSSYCADAENPWEYIWVEFSGQMVERLRILEKRVMPLSDSGIFYDLLHRARENRLSADYFVSRLFFLFSELLTDEAPGHRYEEEVARYIEMYYMRDLSVQMLSRMVHLDRSHLTRVFTKNYHMAPQQYLLQVRMRRAAEFLQTGTPISRVAGMVGYGDVAAFSKAFRRITGKSPRSYVKDLIKE